MALRTPINKNTFKAHLTYNLWKYAVLAVLSVFGWSLIYTQTAYRSPQDKRIDIYIKSSTVDISMCDAFFTPIKESVTPDMEVVNTVSLMANDDYTSVMQMQVYLAAGEGDIYMLPANDFKSYASTEGFIRLDEYIEDGSINVDGINLTAGKVRVVDRYTDDGVPIYGNESYTYGIPMDSLYSFMDGIQLDNRNMVMCIAVNNMNDENVIPFFNALIQAGRGDVPEWLDNK